MGNTFIGLKLRSLRQEENLTQSELSKALGIAKSTIGMYETGQRAPDYETLELLADYFNTPMASFFPDGQTKKDQLTDKDDELTPQRKKLIRFVREASEEEVQMLDRLVQIVLDKRGK